MYVNQSTHKQPNSLTSECEPLVICNVSASHVTQMYPQQKAQQCEAVIVKHVAICNDNSVINRQEINQPSAIYNRSCDYSKYRNTAATVNIEALRLQ